MIEAHGDTPVAHSAAGAARITSANAFSASSYQNECSKRDATVEGLLGRGSAGDRKVHGAELGAVMMLIVSREDAQKQQARQSCA